MNQDEALKQINRSGYPFQLKVESEITNTKQTHHWDVVSREQAWVTPNSGSSGFIDLVLAHKQIPTLRMVIECKRIKADDARQLRWIFLHPDQDLTPIRRASCFEVEGWMQGSESGNSWKDFRIWEDVNVVPASLQSEFCLLPNDEQRRQSILESLAIDVLESIEGLAEEEISVEKSSGQPIHQRLFIFPAIVTNAEIAVCRFNSSLVNISDGTLDPTNAEITSVPFIRFRKSLATGFPQGVFGSLSRANRARERSVFVVNASSLAEFLTGWNIQPLDPFRGYAIEQFSRQHSRF